MLFRSVSFGLIGFFDDYLKIKRRNNRGLTARSKLAWQVLVSFLVAFFLLLLTARGQYSTHLIVPFFKKFRPDLLIDSFLANSYTYPLAFSFFFVFVVVVIVGSSNAVNLTDGLDGLAIGSTLIAAAAFTVLAYVSGHRRFSDYLDVLYLPGAGEVTVFCEIGRAHV